MQSKRWVFTINNPSANDDQQLQELIKNVRYIIYGRERGSLDTPHYQGFVIFTSNARLSACKRHLTRAHWEPARGTSEQARDYCKKDNDYTEHGTFPATKSDLGDRERDRWQSAKEAAKRGDFDAVPADILIRYVGNLQRIHRLYLPTVPDLDTPCGLWIWGEPGAGKSTGVRRNIPESDLFSKPINKWWDGYSTQPNVLLDDFDKVHKVLGHYLKIWSDSFAFIAETKGGAIRIRPSRIIVTSNYVISDIFEDDQLCKALERRFKVLFVNEDNRNFII